MKIIQWIKVKFRKLRDNKVDEPEQRPDFSYEGPRQVLAESNSLKDQLSEANRKIADLENMARTFQAQVSHGKKEEDDGKEKEIKRFEHRIQSKDEKIRLLKDELAMKDEEIQRLKSQQDRREEEYSKLMNCIQSAYTDMENAVVNLGLAFSKFRVKNRPQKGIDYRYDLIGAMSSAEG